MAISLGMYPTFSDKPRSARKLASLCLTPSTSCLKHWTPCTELSPFHFGSFGQVWESFHSATTTTTTTTTTSLFCRYTKMVEDGEIVEAGRNFRWLSNLPISPISPMPVTCCYPAGAGRWNSTGAGPGASWCQLCQPVVCWTVPCQPCQPCQVPVDYTWAKKLGMVRRNEGTWNIIKLFRKAKTNETGPRDAKDIQRYPNSQCPLPCGERHRWFKIAMWCNVSGSQRTSFPPSLMTEGRTGWTTSPRAEPPLNLSKALESSRLRPGAPVLWHQHFGGLFAKPGCFGRTEVDTTWHNCRLI